MVKHVPGSGPERFPQPKWRDFAPDRLGKSRAAVLPEPIVTSGSRSPEGDVVHVPHRSVPDGDSGDGARGGAATEHGGPRVHLVLDVTVARGVDLVPRQVR